MGKNGASISSNYDETVYFAEGKIIPKFAYIKRNEWMIQKADYVFFYVHRSYGEAARMLQYAKARNKPFFNLAEE
ncbi:MAG: hypothetical protein E7363_00640 [Clostridiales bacterium]|nr:hypothetical protein [Clostridiales bacterium]